MFFDETDPARPWNWIAIVCYAASFAVGAAFWTGLVRGVQYLVR